MRIRLRHERLKRELAKSGRSQNAWALALGLDSGHFSKLVNGLRRYPGEATRKKLLDGFDLEFVDLFEIESRPRRRGARVPSPMEPIRSKEAPLSLGHDLRYAFRMMAKRPAFSALAILIVALGVGANSAVFSLVDTVLLSPLPFPKPSELTLLSSFDRARGAVGAVSFPDFVDWSEQSQSFASMAAFQEDSFILAAEDGAEQVRGELISPDYLRMLGADLVHGRGFEGEEVEPVVIVSAALAERRFGDAADIVGETIVINDSTFTVIGVVDPSFEGFGGQSRLWLPMSLFDKLNPSLAQYEILDNRGTRWHAVIGRLAAGVAIDEARAEMETIAAALAEEHPKSNELRSVAVRFAQDEVVSDHRSSLLLLSAAVGFLLLLACVNLANLFLVRVLSRRREVSMRLALGASRGRVVRQLLTETALFSFLGGALGLVVAHVSVRSLVALAPVALPIADDAAVDLRVFAFAFVLASFTGIACGLFPALTAAGEGLVVRDAGRFGFGRRRSLGAFALAEVAIATLLLVGAGLVLKSFYKMQQFDPGFATENLLTMRFHAPPDASDVRSLERMTEEVASVPGVTSAAVASHVYFGGGYMSGNITVEGFEPASRADEVKAYQHFVTDDYFDAMGIPLIRGDGLDASDRAVVVNASFAEAMWPGEDAIGKRLVRGMKQDDKAWLSVVGIVADVRSELQPAEADRLPQFYFSIEDGGDWARSLVARTTGSPDSVVAPVRDKLRQLHPGIAVFAIASMDELLARQRASMRSVAFVMGTFAALALALAALGLYGVIAYTVRQLTHEIGVRVAIGATRRDVVTLVMKPAAIIVATGLGVGLFASFAATRFARSLLYEVQPLDPGTFVTVALGLTAVVLAASYLPARRAARVDPVSALRHE